MELSDAQQTALASLLHRLVDQERARTIVPANDTKFGFWFGGGNLVRDQDGTLWIIGRYRNYGDSRTGLHQGERGLECAVFRSTDDGATFKKAAGWTKGDLSDHGGRVLSIEGTALHERPDGNWEAFISTEKDKPYPEGLTAYQKPGTGVWSIDRLTGSSPDALNLTTLSPLLASDDPAHLHVKDPVVYDDGNATRLMFCTHPVSWASSNTGLATRGVDDEAFVVDAWQFVPRGNVWDVAATRITDRLVVPRLGRFEASDPIEVYFYDGAECMRPLDENPRALSRPRGYSCEELGGALWRPRNGSGTPARLSHTKPLFVSPHGTGCSRYVATLVTDEGIYANWQQAQPDGSQPLVMNFVPTGEIEALLSS